MVRILFPSTDHGGFGVHPPTAKIWAARSDHTWTPPESTQFNLESPHLLWGLEVDWVSLWSSFVVLPPHFDGLVGFTGD